MKDLTDLSVNKSLKDLLILFISFIDKPESNRIGKKILNRGVNVNVNVNVNVKERNYRILKTLIKLQEEVGGINVKGVIEKLNDIGSKTNSGFHVLTAALEECLKENLDTGFFKKLNFEWNPDIIEDFLERNKRELTPLSLKNIILQGWYVSNLEECKLNRFSLKDCLRNLNELKRALQSEKAVAAAVASPREKAIKELKQLIKKGEICKIKEKLKREAILIK